MISLKELIPSLPSNYDESLLHGEETWHFKGYPELRDVKLFEVLENFLKKFPDSPIISN